MKRNISVILKEFIEITDEIFLEGFFRVIDFIKNNLRIVVWLGTLILPYVMYYLGQKLVIERGTVAYGGEIFIPIVLYLLMYYIQSFANKIGKGTSIPIPKKRFTEEDEDEVTVEHSRLQEMLLYLDDLENWLERKGLLK